MLTVSLLPEASTLEHNEHFPELHIKQESGHALQFPLLFHHPALHFEQTFVLLQSEQPTAEVQSIQVFNLLRV